MRVRRIAASVLIGLLSAPPMASVAGAAPQPPSGRIIQVDVDPLRACILAGEYAQFQGSVTPPDGVSRARLFFHSSLSNDFYYVEAVLEGGRYVARIPRPQPEARLITFYLEASKNDLSQARSVEGTAVVVRKIEECPADRKAAAVAPGGPVSVFDVAGNPAFPAGFEGVTGAGVAAAAAGGTGAAAGSGAGFLTSTAGLITLGALAVGITTVVIVTNGNAPKSPSR
jgi:hypothetical protein